MKQILIELWIENKKLPFLMPLKIILIVASLFTGVLLNGYPYSVIFLLLIVSLQSLLIAPSSQVEYFIPRTEQERIKYIIRKSAVVAGFYTLVNAVGYWLTICRYEPYHWDKEMVVFMAMMILFPFLLFFNLKVVYERIRSFGYQIIINKRKPQKLTLALTAVILAPTVSIVCIYGFIFYKLANLSEFQFLGNGTWKIFGMFLILLTLSTLIVQTFQSCKNIMLEDYSE